jgi:hypothetical protein
VGNIQRNWCYSTGYCQDIGAQGVAGCQYVKSFSTGND